MSCVRRAGIANPKQIRCIVLEPSGAPSVLSYGNALDPAVLHDVFGAERALSGENTDPQ